VGDVRAAGARVTAGAAVGSPPVRVVERTQPLRELGPCFLYLIVEVARPADWVPAIGVIRLGLIAALWGALALLRPGRLPIPKPIWYMLGLSLVMSYHVPMARNNYYAFWGFVNFTTLVVGYVLPLATLPRTQDATRVLLNAYVLLHIPTAIHAILYKGTGTGGWMGDENDVALALNVALGVGYYLLPLQRSGFARLLLLVGMALNVAGVVMSNSRGGFVGLAALGAYMVLAGPKRGRIVAAVVVAAIGMALLAPPSYWDEVRSIQDASKPGDTGETRMYFWGIAKKMFWDHPLVGVGTGNYGIRAPEYEDKWRAETTGQHIWGRAAHSLYYTLLAEQGGIGVVLFGLMLLWAFRTFWRLRQGARAPDDPRAQEAGQMASAVMAGMVALLVTGAFLTCIYYPVIWVLVGLLASVDATAKAPGASA
jgi:O-antigen ligase